MLKSSILDKKELTNQNMESMEMIEALRRLQYMRRFSKDETTALKLQINRDLYIEFAVNLARSAGYNYRRVMRIAHEVNRSFETTIKPELVHEYVDTLIQEEEQDITYQHMVDMVDMFDITEDELIEILGTNSEKINVILIPDKIL